MKGLEERKVERVKKEEEEEDAKARRKVGGTKCEMEG